MKQNFFKRSLAVLAITALLCAFGAAAAVDDSASDWARESLSEAISLGFVPKSLQSGYQTPITRQEFASIAMSFVAAQYGYEVGDYYHILTWRASQDPSAPKLTSVFNDGATVDAEWAYALGVVQGRMPGIFDPDASITRQEAAAMLYRAYAVYGGKLGQGGMSQSFTDTFTDSAQVAPWAKESVEALWTLGIMGGTDDEGSLFAPLATYTREQCVVTFLRLWQSAPVSRAEENVPKLDGPTQAEMAAAIEDGTVNFIAPYNQAPLNVMERFDTDLCVILYGEYGGLPHRVGPQLVLIYPDGRCRTVYDGIPPASVWNASPDLENLKLSADKTELTYSVTYPDRLVDTLGSEGRVIHEPGVYSVTLDLATGEAELTVTPLSA